ncbi:MAG: hypothetical protein QM730_00330 [Anaerolineales bacterium]
MTQGTELSILSHWQNFYMIMGTAAATLTGLMFVATTLLAGLNTHTEIANAGISAYNTPTVVQFCAVLLLAGILSAPWQSFSTIDILLGLVGVGMAVYLLITMRRMWQMPHYQSTLEDWLWYIVLPLLASILLILAAAMLSKNSDPSLALYSIGSAIMLLLLTGIRNAWDNVTFLALKRSHTHAENDAQEKKRSGSSNHEKHRHQQ